MRERVFSVVFLSFSLFVLAPVFAFCILDTLTLSEAPDLRFQQESKNIKLIPFQLAGRLIVVKGEIDEHKGNLIVDIGSSNLQLNSRCFGNVGDEKNKLVLNDINGNVREVNTRMVRVKIGALKKNGLEGVLVDLSDLEERKGIDILGLVGFSFFRDLELEIDYTAQFLVIYRLNRRGKKKSRLLFESLPVDSFHLKKSAHFLCLLASVGNEDLCFGIDTGAEINLISERAFKLVQNHFQINSQTMRTSLSNSRKLIKVGRLETMRIDDSILVLGEVAVVNLEALNKLLPRKLDGLLGYQFLSQQRVSINFVKNYLYIW